MRKLLCLAAASALLAIAWFQSRAVTKLEDHQVKLTHLKTEVDRLVKQNARIPTLTASIAPLDQLEAATRDLHRLRSEIGPLRAQTKAYDQAKSENARLRQALAEFRSRPPQTVTLPPDYVSAAAFGDAGLATPEATVQTFFWAMKNGNVERWIQCLTPEQQTKLQQLPPADLEKAPPEMRNAFAQFPGFRVKARQSASSDAATLQIESKPGGSSFEIQLKQVGPEWRISSGFGPGISTQENSARRSRSQTPLGSLTAKEPH